ncbi:response regulator transcription factor [Caldalkalibacillus mannanilyticus]|uniref:response regulator transcription factor n=1 Tax=Caldalkalibacillus mannanilyticus TaxID=1418 RepID=UPI001F3D8635|nr:response regulator [Caldalkalibacillus mannanilyticus]
MMKVILADDEIQIRKGLRMKIDWEEEGFQIMDEASNGEEALEILRKTEAEIIITDMRMPMMDGIELAKHCQREFPHVKVIVLSGYSDFEYVRNSMKHGVRDYLLKPVAPNELVDSLRKIRLEIEEDQKKRGEVKRLNHFVHSHMEEVQERYLLYLVKDEWLHINMVKERLRQLRLDELVNNQVKFQILTVEIRDSHDRPSRLKDLWLTCQLICKEIAKDFSGTYTFYNPSYTNLIHFIQRVDLETSCRSHELANTIQKKMKSFLCFETVIGVGNVVNGLTELKTGYISSLLSWSQGQLGAQSQVINGVDSKNVAFEFPADLEKKLINAIETMDYEAFNESCSELLKQTANHSIMTFSFMTNRLLFLLGAQAKKYDIETKELQLLLWECQRSIWELNSQHIVKNVLLQLAQHIIAKVREARFSNGKLMINSIRRYVDEHYASEISLTSLSEMFHMNSTYLSEIFKLHIGENFSNYLVHLRMKKALELLKDNQLKIIDVANLVGFSSSGYFSTVFKKHFGQSPVEYRTSLTDKVKAM